MTAEDAIRYIAHEGARCHDRDSHEALVLLLPSILNALGLEPMNYADALAFTIELRDSVRQRAQVLTGADFPN